MKYVSIDIETTGLDPDQDQVLQVALVLEDIQQAAYVKVEDLPTFACLVWHPRYIGDAYALGLNGDILKAIASCDNNDPDGAEIRGRRLPVYPAHSEYPREGGLTWEEQACKWLNEQLGNDGKKLNAAGKNAAGFDLQFLKGPLKERFRHRVLDPGSMFWSRSLDTECLPSLADLKKRYNLGDDVAHDAIDDARDVVRVIRKAWL